MFVGQMQKGNKVCALFTHHLHSGDKDYLHWGRVLVVKGSECTIKWQIDKKHYRCVSY